jgi:hypothetical protein
MRVLMVLGLCERVLTAWPTKVESVAVLTYPTVPRFAVAIVAVWPFIWAPMLHRDCRKTDDRLERSLLVSSVMLEKVLRLDGIPFIMGPPATVRLESISTQFVPPRPFVNRTFPVEIKSPVFESRAYTLRRTMVSDIVLSFLDRKALRELPSLRITDRIR